MAKLNILILHSLGNPALAPVSLRNTVFSLQRCFPEHNYLYHDTNLPPPPYLGDVGFDAIVLDVSFLTARWGGKDYLERLKNAYSFVRGSSAVKIAFPQDEYDCNELLDDWLIEWRVDVVFSVISSGWELLYPQYHKIGEIRLGFTGYIDESLIDRPRRAQGCRSIDIGYRATRLPPYFGRLGETKWTIGRQVDALAKNHGLHVDIKIGDRYKLHGDAWLDFIADSRFTLGANSGSSLLDPRGEIQASVRSYLRGHPKASFEEVEKHCFPGLDGIRTFTAISPRVMEAAVLSSGQVLVEGEYSGIVSPWEHYIPIRPDASNFLEVAEAMRDGPMVESMIHRCREAILSIDALRYKTKARRVLDLIAEKSSCKVGVSDSQKVERAIAKYQEEMLPRYRASWKRHQLRRTVGMALAPYPRIHEFFRRFGRFMR